MDHPFEKLRDDVREEVDKLKEHHEERLEERRHEHEEAKHDPNKLQREIDEKAKKTTEDENVAAFASEDVLNEET